MTEKLLPLAAMEKLLKQGGCERVGEDAKDALKEVLESHAQAIAKKAATYAQHAGRRTIKKEDILLAIKE